MTLLWLALTTAQAQDICPSGCTYATLQEGVDAASAGVLSSLTIASGYHHGPVVVEGGRQVLLSPFGVDPVVLSADAGTSAVITVRGAAVLTTTGISVNADGVRAFDVSEDATANVSAGLFYGGGPVAEGALVRVRDGVLVAAFSSFVDGYALGNGGAIHAVDSDVALLGCSVTDSSATKGGGLYVQASGTRRTVTVDSCGFGNLNAVTEGGGMALDGDLDVELRDVLFGDTQAQLGGAVHVRGAGAVVELINAIVDGGNGFGGGGTLYQTAGVVTMSSLTTTGGAGTNGGAITLLGGDLTIEDSLLIDNIALTHGGAIYANGGVLRLRDTRLFSNGAAKGGGLWVGPSAEVPELLRTTFCANSANQGGGAWVEATADISLRNARFLDNVAFEDGGAVRHQGTGALAIHSANFLGSTSGAGGGAAIATSGSLSLVDTLIGFSTGGTAVRRESTTPVVLGGGTAWWLNEQGDAEDLSPATPGAVFTDPLLLGYTPGEDCLTIQDWGGWYGPLRDAGSVDVQDPDGTRADIGAYGGPDADPAVWLVDADADGSPVLYDCDEQNPEVNPLALDTPYDGVDSNCDRADDFDADGDGQRPPEWEGTDCDDTRADVYFGAEEFAVDPPVDHNCDGRFDADGDGFEAADDCDDSDPDAYPGAVDSDPNRDLDCDGFVDVPRVIRPVGCQTGPQGPTSLGLFGLGLVALRRRRVRGAP